MTKYKQQLIIKMLKSDQNNTSIIGNSKNIISLSHVELHSSVHLKLFSHALSEFFDAIAIPSVERSPLCLSKFRRIPHETAGLSIPSGSEGNGETMAAGFNENVNNPKNSRVNENGC